MMHIMLKSVLRSTLFIFFVWLLNLSALLSAGNFRIKNGSYDFNNNGKTEKFTLGSGSPSIALIENISDTLWLYKENKNLKFTDIELIDINKDGLKDLVGTPDLSISIGINNWLYVF